MFSRYSIFLTSELEAHTVGFFCQLSTVCIIEIKVLPGTGNRITANHSFEHKTYNSHKSVPWSRIPCYDDQKNCTVPFLKTTALRKCLTRTWETFTNSVVAGGHNWSQVW